MMKLTRCRSTAVSAMGGETLRVFVLNGKRMDSQYRLGRELCVIFKRLDVHDKRAFFDLQVFGVKCRLLFPGFTAPSPSLLSTVVFGEQETNFRAAGKRSRHS
jgi:hypothetical protein